MACATSLYFLALAVTATFAQIPVKWTRLYVKWATPDMTSLSRELPLTTNEAKKDGWTQAASTNLSTIWCLERDTSLCMLYDLQGTVAGMQISLPVTYFIFPGNDTIDNHPLLFRNNMYDTDLYSARYYLVEQETLAAGGRPPSEEVGTGLWLQSGPDLVEVPRDGDQLAAQSWTRQNCLYGMGRHYFYNLSKEMSCEDLQPYFLLLNNQYNTLHGVGLQMIAKLDVKLRKWFDFVPLRHINLATPDAPPCLKKLAAAYQVAIVHIHFVDKPYYIGCLSPEWWS